MDRMVKKRNGHIVQFERSKIFTTIKNAFASINHPISDDKIDEIVNNIEIELHKRFFKKGSIPSVEEIQDIVEHILMKKNYTDVAKSYILYRQQRKENRELKNLFKGVENIVDDYISESDWKVKENANIIFSVQGLNNYISSAIASKYWLNKIYPEEIKEAHENGDIYIHDLGTIGSYTFFGKEVVIAKLNGDIKLLSLEDLYEEIPEPEILLNEKDEAFAKYPKEFFVLDRNEWTKVLRMVRKRKDREMRFIKSEQGQGVIVTDNHPFIVKEKPDALEREIEAKGVQVKNHLILSCHIPSLLVSEKLFFKKHIYLAEELLKRNYENFFLEGFYWKDFMENWGGSLRVEGTFSTSNSANSLDNKLELTEDLGYLVGFFIAEGNYDSWKLNITNSEEEIIEKIQRICARLGIRTYVREKEGKTKTISINSSTLKIVFEKIFQIKPLSKNKNLPYDILTYNSDFIKGLIAGIIDGDGSISGETQIIIRVASRTMLEQIAILLQFLGIVPRTGVSIKDIGKKRNFRGKEIVQNYPLYRLTFSKKENVDFPSLKYQKAKPAKTHWRSENYGWNRVLNNEATTIPDKFIYDITTESNTFLCNSILVHNCTGWDLEDLLRKGFGGVQGKISSAPPKHFRTALGQLVNFLFSVQMEVAGAVAVSNFNTLLAPFIKYDKLDRVQVKQALQEFVYNMNVSTRSGGQSPFSNVTLDLEIPEHFKGKKVIIAGKEQDATYDEFENEMNLFIDVFTEVLTEGDYNKRIFTFPIPTIAITKTLNWNNPAYENIWKATAKYGYFYFANYVNSDMKPEDIRSMCFTADTRLIYKEGKHSRYQRTTIRNLVNNWNPKKEFYLLINGKWVKIIDAFKLKNNSGKIIKVELRNGEIIKMTPDHPAMIIENGKLKQVLAKNLKVGDFIPIAKNTYEGRLGDFELGRWLGLYVSEGGINKNEIYFSFNKNEKELQEFVKKVAEERFAFPVRVTKDPRWDTIQVWVKSKSAVEWVRKFCSGEKAPRKRLLASLYGMSKDFRLGVLVGIYQGDGYERDVEFHTTNRKLRDDVADLARSIGINYTKRINPNNTKGEKNYTSYVLRLCRDSLKELAPYFKNIKISNSSIFRDFGDFYGIKIKSIKVQNYYASVYDFEVDSKEHLFQLSNGVITHNCCRLSLNMKELRKRTGGVFGAGNLSGSCGIVTINLPRLGYVSKDENEFFSRLDHLLELAKTSLEIKRKTVEQLTEKNFYPYCKVYLEPVKQTTNRYWSNHFSTIGIIGLNECSLNFLGVGIEQKEGHDFAQKVLLHIREKIAQFQEETGNLYNLEAVPGEGSSYSLALKDKKRFPRIKTQGTDTAPYYTNGTGPALSTNLDIFDYVRIQDDLISLLTGGGVVHLFLGENINDWQMAKELVKKVTSMFKVPYLSITPSFSICPVHGYIPGVHKYCPYPHTEEDISKYGIEIEVTKNDLSGMPGGSYAIINKDEQSNKEQEKKIDLKLFKKEV